MWVTRAGRPSTWTRWRGLDLVAAGISASGSYIVCASAGWGSKPYLVAGARGVPVLSVQLAASIPTTSRSSSYAAVMEGS
ncbi:hypothetical protein PF005_g21662 [Phytophthora fragariae]|uniref:Uncharacterized protein n=2 Tax=Phytophthora TaxID=4783 RepID=A0A6A3S4X0_9STRA|nr:hypothetical protein PF003_g12573 [Phytophthora fragariae]KAE8987136.1 hypothetical protein PR001_g22415 [Phytophthora rubi]KAE8926835.1 hypothetical protein PF009_g22983 [Phytophthora fragariae]KAE8985432.1 hypothetical protein PF011_g20391 [Phytophthora fragariae]KAE8987810.1 hypothetical protein PR002_g21945 [Phytophthora rubi]